VTVDNTPPGVAILNPPDDKVYKMEDDEWVNIQVEAVDNVSMDRVEFYLDGREIDEATVAPYNARWTIVMSDTIPVEGTVITQTDTVTSPEGIISEQVVTVTEVITIPNPEVITEALQYVQVYSGGLTIISDTTSITPGVGYTETHTLKIIAYDAAGNKTESEITSFSVIHDPEALEEEQSQAILSPTDQALFRRNTLSGWTTVVPIAWLRPFDPPDDQRQITTDSKIPSG
jgi:hypothetical protein